MLQAVEPMQVDVAPESDQLAQEDNFIVESATLVTLLIIYVILSIDHLHTYISPSHIQLFQVCLHCSESLACFGPPSFLKVSCQTKP